MCYLKTNTDFRRMCFQNWGGSIVYLVRNILFPSPFEIALRPIPSMMEGSAPHQPRELGKRGEEGGLSIIFQLSLN